MTPSRLESPAHRPVAVVAPPSDQAPPPTAVAACVILPVYNEAAVVPRTFAAVCEFLRTSPEYTFLFVDDGSTDGTARVLTDLIQATGAQGVSVIGYAENRGKGHAIHEGVLVAPGDFILFTDGDLAYPLTDLERLLDALKVSDVAIGSRSLTGAPRSNTGPLRRFMGESFNRLVRVILGLPYRDTQAGIKGFRARAAREIFSRQRLRDFAFDTEMLFIARRLGLKVGEIPVHVTESHTYKTSKVRPLPDSVRMLWSLVRVRANGVRGRYD